MLVILGSDCGWQIVIKADKHYAIIDFSDVEAAQRALDAPAPKYDGSILKVISNQPTTLLIKTCFVTTDRPVFVCCRLKSAVKQGILGEREAEGLRVGGVEPEAAAMAKPPRRMGTPQLVKSLAKVGEGGGWRKRLRLNEARKCTAFVSIVEWSE